MPQSYRLMIRLTPDLYAQLEACGSSGQPLAAIVRQALIDYLTRQPEQPAQPARLDYMPERLTALTITIQELHEHARALTARVDALAAPQQPQAADNPSAATEQPEQPTREPLAPFDPTRFVLGPLCPRRHAYGDTGQTLRRLPRHICPACDREQTAERRKAKREAAQ